MSLRRFLTDRRISYLMKTSVVFIFGGFGLHLLAMLIDYFFMPAPLNFVEDNSYFAHIFSVSMFPMMLVYGLCIVVPYMFWHKLKAVLHYARQKEVQNEKTLQSIHALQRITGLLAEHITSHNTDILQWVEDRRVSGRSMS